MYSELEKIMAPEQVLYNQPMSRHTTFKIGGPVDVLIEPHSSEQLHQIIVWCQHHKVPYIVFGAASNLLVRDKGIRGLGIKLGENFKHYQVEGSVIMAQSGILLSELATIAAEHALSGLEYAEGIPGTLGGAVVMNAGAYDGEMKDVLLEVTALSPEGELKTLTVAELEMGYRHSIFQDNSCIVVSASLALRPGKKADIVSKMSEFAHRRKEKQPLELPSAGSVFRRPEGFYVGPLLEQMGLKGLQVGGAQVSTKHAGFIVNAHHATAGDVLLLIEKIRAKAREEMGVDLQTEIRIVGEE